MISIRKNQPNRIGAEMGREVLTSVLMLRRQTFMFPVKLTYAMRLPDRATNGLPIDSALNSVIGRAVPSLTGMRQRPPLPSTKPLAQSRGCPASTLSGRRTRRV